MITCSGSTLDALAAKHGTLADWMPSNGNRRLQSALRARTHEIMKHLSETDAALLTMLGLRGMTQTDAARLLGLTQPSVCSRYATVLRRARYLANLLDRAGDVPRALRDLNVEEGTSKMVIEWLMGASSARISARAEVGQTTVWKRIKDVEVLAGGLPKGRAAVLHQLMVTRRSMGHF